MTWTANSLAKTLGCAWQTVRRAIRRNEVKAVWDGTRRAWLIENGRELTLFRARLDYLRQVRRERSERMRVLWRTGKLRPKRRKRVEVVERLKRPTVIAVGQGVYTRTVGIVWRDDEGETHCPCCSAMLKVK